MANREFYPSGSRVAIGTLAAGTVTVALPGALLGRTKILSVGLYGTPAGGGGGAATYGIGSVVGTAAGVAAGVNAVVNSSVAGDTSTVAINYLP